MGEQESGVLAELKALADRLAQRGWSQSQGWQLEMTRGQLERAVTSGLLPEQAQSSLAGLLAGEGRRVFLELAETGVFRRPDRQFRRPSTVHTANALILWTGRLAEAAGLTPEKAAYRWAAREPVGEQHLRMFGSYLAQRVRTSGLSVYEVRFTAMALMALETGPRVGELAQVRMEHLSEDRRRVWLVRNPQRHEGPGGGDGRWESLSGVAARALRRWEPVREESVSHAGGGKTALWVTLRVNGRPEPQGLPLQALDGLITTWAAGVSRVNGALQGSPGWPGPMSVHIESLRRGVEARRAAAGKA